MKRQQQPVAVATDQQQQQQPQQQPQQQQLQQQPQLQPALSKPLQRPEQNAPARPISIELGVGPGRQSSLASVQGAPDAPYLHRSGCSQREGNRWDWNQWEYSRRWEGGGRRVHRRHFCQPRSIHWELRRGSPWEGGSGQWKGSSGQLCSSRRLTLTSLCLSRSGGAKTCSRNCNSSRCRSSLH
ncbi:hypothetical protein T492DRAFT_1091787 [Pavlovales sp. CCMP2436]|nr:hypothetical protein T492DRAFT_1091787 [Pavlovales sp. CCMP2436]